MHIRWIIYVQRIRKPFVKPLPYVIFIYSAVMYAYAEKMLEVIKYKIIITERRDDNGCFRKDNIFSVTNVCSILNI